MTIDWWTLGLQTVNVVILIWLLQRFFWRPVAAMIEQRRVTAQQTLASAEATRSQANAALADIERTRAGFAKERDTILTDAHKAADEAAKVQMGIAGKAAAAREAAANAAIATSRQDAEQAWNERASGLAVTIAQRLAARLDGPAVRAAFLDWLLTSIRALPEPTRRAATADDGAMDAISATPLEPAEQEHTRGLIGAAFGAQPRITFTTEPALIAGIELHARGLVVSNSWQADLTHILADLAHDKRR